MSAIGVLEKQREKLIEARDFIIGRLKSIEDVIEMLAAETGTISTSNGHGQAQPGAPPRAVGRQRPWRELLTAAIESGIPITNNAAIWGYLQERHGLTRGEKSKFWAALYTYRRNMKTASHGHSHGHGATPESETPGETPGEAPAKPVTVRRESGFWRNLFDAAVAKGVRKDITAMARYAKAQGIAIDNPAERNRFAVALNAYRKRKGTKNTR